MANESLIIIIVGLSVFLLILVPLFAFFFIRLSPPNQRLSDVQFSKMMEHNQVLQAQIKEQESEIRQLHQEFTAYQADCDKKMTGLQAELERSTHMMAILVAELEVREGEEYKNSIKEEAQRILQRGREVYKYKKPPPKGKG